MARSADVLTVVSSLSVLLAGTGSGVIDATVAVLVMVPRVSESTVTTIVMVDDAPAIKLLRVQVTTPLLLAQIQPVPEALPKVTPAGRVSVTTTLSASDGPAFWTSRV